MTRRCLVNALSTLRRTIRTHLRCSRRCSWQGVTTTLHKHNPDILLLSFPIAYYF